MLHNVTKTTRYLPNRGSFGHFENSVGAARRSPTEPIPRDSFHKWFGLVVSLPSQAAGVNICWASASFWSFIVTTVRKPRYKWVHISSDINFVLALYCSHSVSCSRPASSKTRSFVKIGGGDRWCVCVGKRVSAMCDAGINIRSRTLQYLSSAQCSGRTR